MVRRNEPEENEDAPTPQAKEQQPQITVVTEQQLMLHHLEFIAKELAGIKELLNK
jgi:hypothetical protein